MRFVCDSCRAQYMISDDKIGAKGVKVRCKKCGYVITVRASGATSSKDDAQGAAEAASAESKGRTDTAGVGLPASVGTPPEGGLFTDVEEDEIGAVFDSVLNSGSHKIPAGEPVGDEASAKSLDSVSKLAEEEEGEPKPPASSHEWFVAIDEKQVGPLTVEKVKDHWERGEVGPDSLCWRSGFSDWIPLSEVTELASELAPRPASKPVIVVPAAVSSSTPVASAPVESAFSAGNASKSSRAESPLASSAMDEPTPGWKPSAASVLASLVKEEDEALSRPAPKAEPVVETRPASTGLLDLPPPEPVQAPSPLAAVPAPAPVMAPPVAAPYAPPAPQYAQPPAPYAQPGYQAYPPPVAAPPPSGNKMAVIGAVAALALVSIGGGVVYMMTRPPAVTPPPAAVAAVTPTPESVQPAAKPAEALPMPPPPAAVAQTPPAAVAGTQQPAPAAQPTTPPAATGTPAQGGAVAAGTQQTPPPAVEAVKPVEQPKPTTARVETTPPKKPTTTASRPTSSETEPPPKVASNEPRPKPEVSDDEFDELFGTKKPAKREEPADTKRPATYIPPEPGTSKTPERLAQSDVMQVVLNNKPAIVKCVNEQKKKDPTISGKLVMKWTIQTSGKTSAIACQSAEFKSTYMAKCIGDLIKTWSFPKHQKQGDPIVFPFTF
jgi:predicted Zn finger-like uncharacterized protein